MDGKKRIYVVSNKYWYDLDRKVIDFVSEFQKILERIPPEYQEEAEINTCEETFDIFYDRPLTKEDEYEERIKQQKINARIEQKERDMYETLKRKYEV